jgi:hypothetical protein
MKPSPMSKQVHVLLGGWIGRPDFKVGLKFQAFYTQSKGLSEQLV